MSEQVQHFQDIIDYEQLKEFLFAESNKILPLNQQLGLYLAVNFRSGAELAHDHHAYAVITVDGTYGVRTWYYDCYARKLSRIYASEDIVRETERARKEIQALFSRIKADEYRLKLNTLSYVLGEERAKELINCPNQDILTNRSFNDYGPITSFEEREQLRFMGMEIVILEMS